tara:strand:+ start:548 stop:829 length:282 start_codon:yes stop_codon:yes gene_type:complete
MSIYQYKSKTDPLLTEQRESTMFINDVKIRIVSEYQIMNSKTKKYDSHSDNVGSIKLDYGMDLGDLNGLLESLEKIYCNDPIRFIVTFNTNNY